MTTTSQDFEAIAIQEPKIYRKYVISRKDGYFGQKNERLTLGLDYIELSNIGEMASSIQKYSLQDSVALEASKGKISRN